ncbi:MAG: hypothetical protein QOF76_3401 [Solirubrobacteraceae bacterium]|jgi:cytochrome P450|nr:hypothetical protein [Solirubrobacteraceae bacterium]
MVQRELHHEVMNVVRSRAFEARVEAHAAALVGAVATLGAADLLPALAAPLPMLSIFEVLGVTDPVRAAVGAERAHSCISGLGDADEFEAGVAGFAGFCYEEISARRAEPRGDLLTRLAAGERMTDEAIISLLTGFLVTGLRSTAAAIASLLRRVAQDAELRDRLTANPELIGATIKGHPVFGSRAGAHFARLQLLVALETVLRELPGLRLAGAITGPGPLIPTAWDPLRVEWERQASAATASRSRLTSLSSL